MSRSKARGTAWETAIVDYLRTVGAIHAERRALNGAKARGALAGLPGVVVEAKSAAKLNALQVAMKMAMWFSILRSLFPSLSSAGR